MKRNALLPAAASCLVLGACMYACERIPNRAEIDFGSFSADETVVATPQILSTEAWQFGGQAGHTIRTTHYRIYTTETNQVLRDRMAAFLEYSLAHYRTVLAQLPAPPVRLDTYLMDNRPQWENLTRRLMGSEADQLTTIQRGGFASRGIGVYYDLGLFDTLAIAGHEGWHQYTQRTFRDPLPVWLEEGLATYMEGHRWKNNIPQFLPWANTERFDQLRGAARRGNLLALEDLLGSKPQDHLGQTSNDRLLTYYAQVWAMTHFLAEGEGGKYSASLRRLLEDAAAGDMRAVIAQKHDQRAANLALATRVGSQVFTAYFNADLAAAQAEYEAFVKGIVKTGGREAIVAGRSPQ